MQLIWFQLLRPNQKINQDQSGPSAGFFDAAACGLSKFTDVVVGCLSAFPDVRGAGCSVFVGPIWSSTNFPHGSEKRSLSP
jgi:hypothetical protein